MSVYAVFIRETTKDEAELAAYTAEGSRFDGRPPHDPYSPPMAGKRVLEGPDVEGVVSSKFPSFDESESVGTRKPRLSRRPEHRFRSTDYQAIIVEGVER